MRKQWRCFHCDALFTRSQDAAEHFGAHYDDTPACCLRDHEHHLVHYIRRLEQELASYRAEDSDVMRSIMTLEVEHRQAVIQAEENGYAKGLRDAARYSENAAASSGPIIATQSCDGSADDGDPPH